MRLREKLLLLLILTSLAIFTGCAKTPEPPPQEPVITDVRDYFPAEPAMTWNYEGTGNEYAGFTRRVMYRQSNQVQMAESNGGTRMGLVYQVTADSIIQTLSLEEFYTDKLLFGEKPNRQIILLQAPLKVGAVWQDGQDKREIVSINETVQVPAGSFHQVVKVKITALDPQRQDQRFEYYAPHTGLIMREFIADNYAITSKLKSVKKTVSSEIKEDTIVLEGMAEKFILHFVEGEPLPFYTYRPFDMAKTKIISDKGTEYRFNSNFAEKKRDDIYLTIFFYSQATKLEEGLRNAEGIISRTGWQKEVRMEQRYPWAIKQWDFKHKDKENNYTGSLAVGQHNNLVFYIMTHFSPEFGDGFIPRYTKILDEFRWTDTNEKLTE